MMMLPFKHRSCALPYGTTGVGCYSSDNAVGIELLRKKREKK